MLHIYVNTPIRLCVCLWTNSSAVKIDLLWRPNSVQINGLIVERVPLHMKKIHLKWIENDLYILKTTLKCVKCTRFRHGIIARINMQQIYFLYVIKSVKINDTNHNWNRSNCTVQLSLHFFPFIRLQYGLQHYNVWCGWTQVW